MAKKEEKESKKETASKEKRKVYTNLIDKLQEEREKLSDEITRDYKEGRRYVRSHPEEGVLIGLIGGIAIGILLGRLTK
ncbi:hypothetical protein G3570_06735 [Balneolaceae bacterium YR4-1]|uniref:DUF883 domain-containing protein n=1 Tax=Halalkalibaculum roseum TaxID=2709311 RepID=A0A6M1STS0_9BACT|nr:hypothetical protein [Halalkalibaculum roseum]NGP76320.1 hypothetical protein [Halalkalibaculum roseum]